MDINRQIQILERRVRALTMMLILMIAAWCLVTLHAQSAAPASLRVRNITVVDAKGTERIWIGAPVADPINHGKRVPRNGPVSGIIVLDAKGNERGVFIGLDSEQRQEAPFLVNAEGGGHLSIYDNQGNQARLGVLQARPMLSLEEKSKVVFAQPVATR